MKPKSWILLLWLCAVMVIGACATEGTFVSPNPTNTNKPFITVFVTPTHNNPSVTAVNTAVPQAWGTPSPMNMERAALISNEVVLLPEVSSITVLLSGDICLMGVVFSEQHSGGLTEPMYTVLRNKAIAVDPEIKHVGVSADGQVVQLIKDIQYRIMSEKQSEEIKAAFDQLANQLAK